MKTLRTIVLLAAVITATIAVTAVTTPEPSAGKPEPSFAVNFLSVKPGQVR